jgi:hypothetical protein
MHRTILGTTTMSNRAEPDTTNFVSEKALKGKNVSHRITWVPKTGVGRQTRELTSSIRFGEVRGGGWERIYQTGPCQSHDGPEAVFIFCYRSLGNDAI